MNYKAERNKLDTISFTLTKELIEHLNRAAVKTGLSRSEVLRNIIEYWIENAKGNQL